MRVAADVPAAGDRLDKTGAAEIDRVLSRNRTAWVRIEHGADDPVDWGALGFTIQTLYGVLENYFRRISKYFENDLPPDRWHIALVERMELEIPDVRPAFLQSPEQTKQVREIVRFRHRLRNLYGEDLDPRKATDVQQTVEEFFARFPSLHAGFASSTTGNAAASASLTRRSEPSTSLDRSPPASRGGSIST